MAGHKFKMTTKIAEFYQPVMWPHRFYVGFSGDINAIPDIADFYQNIQSYKKPPKVGGVECLVLTEDKKIFTFVNPGKWLEVKESCYAVGSGGMFAMGAMEAGKTPKEALKIAAKKDPNTGMGIKVYTF